MQQTKFKAWDKKDKKIKEVYVIDFYFKEVEFKNATSGN